MTKVNFCTCEDHGCPFNPVNHDHGCTPCIAKNLKAGEIPTCFFNSLDPEKTADRGAYQRADYARLVRELESSAPEGRETKNGEPETGSPQHGGPEDR